MPDSRPVPSWYAVVLRAEAVIGAIAGIWLDRSNRALDGNSAAQMLFTPDGRLQVAALLERIAKGEEPGSFVEGEADLSCPSLTVLCDVAKRALGANAESWFETRRKGFGGANASFILFTPDGRARVLAILRKLERGDVLPAEPVPEPARAPPPPPPPPPPVAPAPTKVALMGFGVGLMGEEEFQSWLKQPRLMLDGRTPVDCLTAPQDRRLVMSLLEAVARGRKGKADPDPPDTPPQPVISNAAIFALAARLFGDKADEWLEEPRGIFGGETATFMMYTPSGRARVQRLLEAAVDRANPPPPAATPPDPNGTAGIIDDTRRLFGTGADAWLEEPRPELDDRAAVVLMISPTGRKKVRSLLDRLLDLFRGGPPADSEPAPPPLATVGASPSAAATGRGSNPSAGPASNRARSADSPGTPATASTVAPPVDDPNSARRIFQLAEQLFGPQSDAWLDEARAWFGDQSAASLMTTPAGRSRVMSVLRTLEAGGDPAVPGSEAPPAQSILVFARMLFADRADRWLKQRRDLFSGRNALELMEQPDGRILVMSVLKDIRAGRRPAD